jgi:hypothetical protein
MRIVNDLSRGLLAALALVGLQVAVPAHAQYSPYPQTTTAYPQSGAPSYVPAAQQPYAQAPQQSFAPPATPAYAPPAVGQPAYAQLAQRPVAPPAMPQQPFSPQQPPQQAAPATIYSQYTAAQNYNPVRPADVAPAYVAAAPAPSTTPALTYAQQAAQQSAQRYAARYSPPRMAMAYQTPAEGAENLSLNPQPENVTPVPAQNGGYGPQPVSNDAYSAIEGTPAPNGGVAGADCNCQSNGYESYPAYNAAGAAGYGSCDTYSTYGYDKPGMMARVLGKHGCGYWFGGVYGLVMERDSADKYPLSFQATGLSPGDYPMPSDIVMDSRDVDSDFQGGVEFRFGRTFGGLMADPCGYGCGCCGPTWGIEGVYWTLFEDNQYTQYVYDGTTRLYSMMPMRGLQFDPGAGAAPVNEFWDYAPPVATTPIIVTMTKARSAFEVQNVELNLLRLSLCGNACAAPAVCNVGCDSGSCESGSCDTCATGNCDKGYGFGGGCSRFSCTGVCGFRYLEFDESFMYGVNYYNTGNAASGYLDYWANTENRLFGGQIGCNGMYRIGCKWGLHMNTLVGLFGNDIDVEQYFYSSGGNVTYTTGEDFDVDASKTDVSMLGEVRLGASYQATCHCRLYGGWRAIGITGLALAPEQTPIAFLNAAQMAGYVNSNGSMILHGLQTGIEWNY